jgi:choline-sulfatase
MDTTRSDHLSCYGYNRATTPCIDSLATAGTRWTRVQAQSSWTLPAIASIMTGMSDRAHRAGMWDGVFYGIDPTLPFLPYLMNSAGFQTAAFFNVVFLDASFGFNRGFGHFDCAASIEATSIRNAETTTDSVLSWLDTGRDEARPFFIAVHYYDPHLTYDPPSECAEEYCSASYTGGFGPAWGSKTDVAAINSGEIPIFQDDLSNLVDLYDGEIAFTDAQIGRLLAGLRSRGLSSRTLIVLVADHGEEFLDHGGLGHGHTLFQELLSVPLIVSGPDVPADYVDSTLVGQMDIAPTILAYSGLERPGQMEGFDILSSPPVDRVLPSSLLMTTGGRVTVRRSDQKIHWEQASGNSVQFDLLVDPYETAPLSGIDSTMLEAAEYFWATPAQGHPASVDLAEAAENALRDLGYIR